MAPVVWKSLASFVAFAVRGKRRMNITISTLDGEKWAAIALESDQDSTVGVLESHAHELVCTGVPVTVAFRKSEAYIQKWLRLGEPSKACPCDRISKSRRRR